jgi:HAD superfamily hydrolase (TIGR01509 family)
LPSQTAYFEGAELGEKTRDARFKPVPFSALSSFKSVIFDLDGVIVDSEKVHPRTFELALGKYGIKIDSAHWKRNYTGIGSYAIFDDLVKKHGITEDARELVKKRNEIYLEEIRKNRLMVIEGFQKVHSVLLQNGIKEVVASGGHANHVAESLRASGLKGVPFVAIEHVKKGKPSPEIFLRAAKKIGAKPSECIVFEDSLSGMEAAALAGMPCVALCTTMPRRELMGRAALIIRDFKSKKLHRLLAILLADINGKRKKKQRK